MHLCIRIFVAILAFSIALAGRDTIVEIRRRESDD